MCMQIRLATHSDAKCTRSRLGLCNNVGKAVYANQPLRTTTVSFFIRIVDGKLGLKSISNKKKHGVQPRDADKVAERRFYRIDQVDAVGRR